MQHHLECDPRQMPKDGNFNSHGDVHDVKNADDQLAEEFGYKPVFKREFGYLSTFSFAVSISGLFATTMTTFSYPLSSGGSAGVVWCWLISGAGCMCLACSVAELVSAYPTSGGLYFTVSRLAPPEWVPSLSWITGWLNLMGQITGVASAEYGSAQMLLAAVSMSLDYKYEITTSMTVGVMAALLLFCGFINSLSTYWMEKMTKSYVIFHLCVLLSCCIALLLKTENKHTSEYVFTHIESETGWSPLGFSFLFGFLSVTWTMTDYDATAHITEEISEPEVKAPWAISLAMFFTYIAGFLFNIVLCYCMGDPNEILDSPTIQPVAQIFINSLGKTGGIFYTFCGFIILQFVCFTAMQAAARTVFAFSRDGLIPFSKLWLKINRWTGTPLNAVWITVLFCILINLIGLGSTTAIAGVFDVCAISLDWSYCIPIFCKLFYGKFEPGPWHMGKFSWWINIWGLIWTFFVSVIFVLPTIRPVTALNMNFAIAFLALLLALAWIFWIVSGKKYYTGPVVEGIEDEITISSEEDRERQKSKNSNV
ncbi:putative amino-acid permease C15C4.04c [Golovinomyces cichoracearum]|uniref:Putative amino-acid permease C15C4.04c n=1 Tax=Golovinomyces cichoracearum TaxID=62708 RepID=A0A420HMA8_9PEZI|nr:putative amino-acid permease C15C4.04c [Golovinomyces cichoracearum]